MKTLLWISLQFLFAFTLNAQKYSFKKGKITADAVVIAKYDSKGGVFKKLTIKFASTDDQQILYMEGQRYDFDNPFLPDGVAYLNFSQPSNPGKTIQYKLPRVMNEKEILMHLFKDGSTSFIKDNKVDEEEFSKFVGATPYNFTTDSLAVRKMEEENKARIAKLIPRDKSKPIELKKVDIKDKNAVSETIVFDIYQAQLIIGRLEKRITQGMSQKVDYSVWIKSEPFVYEGKQYNYSPVAYFENASDTFDNEVIMMKDKSEVKFKTPGSMYQSAEYPFVNWLISSGNL